MPFACITLAILPSTWRRQRQHRAAAQVLLTRGQHLPPTGKQSVEKRKSGQQAHCRAPPPIVSLNQQDWSVPLETDEDGPFVQLKSADEVAEWLAKPLGTVPRLVLFVGEVLHDRITVRPAPVWWQASPTSTATRVWKKVQLVAVGSHAGLTSCSSCIGRHERG